MLIIDEMNSRLKTNPVPHNLVKWFQIRTILKIKTLNLNLYVQKLKKIDDEISANVYRTITLFKKLGINLESNKEFNNYKDIINAIVRKRNQTVHHNNEASDISFSDILGNIDIMKDYICSVHSEVLIHIK